MKMLDLNNKPDDSAGLTGLLFRGLMNLIQAFANNHKASHAWWKLSAPHTADFVPVAGTGGALTSSTTCRFRLAFGTPNGQSKASDELSVALGGLHNAYTFAWPAVDAEHTPYGYVFQAPTGATTGATCYQCASTELVLVSGAGASIAPDGKLTLSTTEPTVIRVIAYPPNTQTAHTVLTNDTGAQDPLEAIAMKPFVQTDDGVTITVTRGDTVERHAYNSEGAIDTITIERPVGLAVARYAFAHNGNTISMTQEDG